MAGQFWDFLLFKNQDVDKIFVSAQLPWRNWLARSTVNRKVGGSSPPGSENSFGFAIYIKEGKVKEDKSY